MSHGAGRARRQPACGSFSASRAGHVQEPRPRLQSWRGGDHHQFPQVDRRQQQPISNQGKKGTGCWAAGGGGAAAALPSPPYQPKPYPTYTPPPGCVSRPRSLCFAKLCATPFMLGPGLHYCRLKRHRRGMHRMRHIVTCSNTKQERARED